MHNTTIELQSFELPHGIKDGQQLFARDLVNEYGAWYGVELSADEFEDSCPVTLSVVNHERECQCDRCRCISDVWNQTRWI